MTIRVRLADFLCKRIYDAGCHQMFGVPGDFNLGFLNRVMESPVEYVGCCNELNAAYAADGCARITGLSACVTTYAVGELSALNGIAGAYAECVPVIKITGAPAREHYRQRPLLHHTLGDYMTPYHIYERVTVDQAILNDHRTAAKAIDRVVKHCLLFKQPVYIAVPSDMVDEEIDVDEDLVEWMAPKEPVSDPSALEEAVDEIVARVEKSKHPLFIPGVELIRRSYQSLFEKITNKTKIPYVTMLLGKGILGEDHPNFMGLYMGHRSRPEIKESVAASDCVIIFGEKLTDLNTGGFTQGFNDRNRVLINYDNVRIGSHGYTGIYFKDVLAGLLERLPERTEYPYDFPRAMHSCVNRADSPTRYSPNEKLSMKKVFKKFAQYLQSDMVVIAETGASMFATAETMLPHGCMYFGQTFYGSIGYTVGACFGASLALKREGKGRRVLLVVGDGSFQLTCQEVSSMVRFGCNPLVILVNNDGYLIERVITDNSYNDIQMWKYALLPQVFGLPEKACFKCETIEQLDKALEYAKTENDHMTFVEAVFEKWDCNLLLKSAGRMMALNNHLEPSITEDMLEHAAQEQHQSTEP